MVSPSGRDGRKRARVTNAATAAVLLAVIVPLLVLDLDIPFYGVVGMVLVAAGIIYLVERWEDPARAQQRWAGGRAWTAALVLGLGSAAATYIILLG